jgi:hypothetical protein
LLSSPGVVTGVLLSFLSTVASADFGAVGFPSFDPDGRIGSPFWFGSGVSAAKAEALVINTAANTKLETLIIGFSLSRLREGNVSGEGLFQRKEALGLVVFRR